MTLLVEGGLPPDLVDVGFRPVTSQDVEAIAAEKGKNAVESLKARTAWTSELAKVVPFDDDAEEIGSESSSSRSVLAKADFASSKEEIEEMKEKMDFWKKEFQGRGFSILLNSTSPIQVDPLDTLAARYFGLKFSRVLWKTFKRAYLILFLMTVVTSSIGFATLGGKVEKKWSPIGLLSLALPTITLSFSNRKISRLLFWDSFQCIYLVFLLVVWIIGMAYVFDGDARIFYLPGVFMTILWVILLDSSPKSMRTNGHTLVGSAYGVIGCLFLYFIPMIPGAPALRNPSVFLRDVGDVESAQYLYQFPLMTLTFFFLKNFCIRLYCKDRTVLYKARLTEFRFERQSEFESLDLERRRVVLNLVKEGLQVPTTKAKSRARKHTEPNSNTLSGNANVHNTQRKEINTESGSKQDQSENMDPSAIKSFDTGRKPRKQGAISHNSRLGPGGRAATVSLLLSTFKPIPIDSAAMVLAQLVGKDFALWLLSIFCTPCMYIFAIILLVLGTIISVLALHGFCRPDWCVACIFCSLPFWFGLSLCNPFKLRYLMFTFEAAYLCAYSLLFCAGLVVMVQDARGLISLMVFPCIWSAITLDAQSHVVRGSKLPIIITGSVCVILVYMFVGLCTSSFAGIKWYQYEIPVYGKFNTTQKLLLEPIALVLPFMLRYFYDCVSHSGGFLLLKGNVVQSDFRTTVEFEAAQRRRRRSLLTTMQHFRRKVSLPKSKSASLSVIDSSLGASDSNRSTESRGLDFPSSQSPSLHCINEARSHAKP